MRVLTIDTATSASSVGLVDGVELAAETVAEPHAAQHVLAAVVRVLAEAGADLASVQRVAIGRGPGSFTGLRIGIATGLGIADGCGAEVAAAPTLSALRHEAGERSVAVVDARRGEVFAEGPGVPLAAYAPGSLRALLAADALLVGDGAIRHRADLGDLASIPADDSPLHVPRPRAIAAVAAAGGVEPLYVRDPDAVPTAERT